MLFPLALRNQIRIALGRHPAELRARYPDLAWLDLPRGAVVFDVGAHRGEFTECVLAYQPWARVYAFEPQPVVCAELGARLGPFERVTIERVGLGAAVGEADFFVSAYDQASSFLPNGAVLREGVYGLDFTRAATIRVPVSTIDTYLAEHPIPRLHLLKLDVQGFELEVLKGAEASLPHVDWIYCEAHFQELYRGGPRVEDVFAYLHPRGFELRRMVAFRADDHGRLMECDMLFRNRQS